MWQFGTPARHAHHNVTRSNIGWAVCETNDEVNKATGHQSSGKAKLKTQLPDSEAPALWSGATNCVEISYLNLSNILKTMLIPPHTNPKTSIVESAWIGTMRSKPWILVCQSISPRFSNASNTRNQCRQYHAPPCKYGAVAHYSLLEDQLDKLTRNRLSPSSKSSAEYCITQEQWIWLPWLH